MQLDLATITLPIWLVWMAGISIFFFGGFIGYLDSNSRTANKVEAAENKMKAAIKEAEMKIAEALAKGHEQGQDQPANTRAAMDDPGLLRIKNVNGTPGVEVDGVPVNIKSITPEKKKRLIELISILRPWLEGAPNPRSASAPAAAHTPTQPLAQPPVTAVKALDEKSFRQLSIVNQIDTVLQSYIVDTPLATRGIRLNESASGGVEVFVGLNKYSSIDDVPDLEIKTLIRAAIAAWEEKYTPKL